MKSPRSVRSTPGRYPSVFSSPGVVRVLLTVLGV